MLSENELSLIETGEEVTKETIRGKKPGAMITIDLLGGACAKICQENPERMTASICHRELQKQKFEVTYGKPFSRDMVKTRLARLWEIGFIQQKSETTDEGYKRHVYYISEGGQESQKVTPTSFDPLRTKTHPYFETAKSGRNSCKTWHARDNSTSCSSLGGCARTTGVSETISSPRLLFGHKSQISSSKYY